MNREYEMNSQEQFHKLEYADGVAVSVKEDIVDTEQLRTVKTVEIPITFHQGHKVKSEFTAVSVKEEAMDTEQIRTVKTVEIPIKCHQEHKVKPEFTAVSVKEEAVDTEQLGAEWGPQYSIDIEEADVKGECTQVSSAGAGHSHTGHNLESSSGQVSSASYHSTGERCECAQCGEAYPSKASLINHLREHEGEAMNEKWKNLRDAYKTRKKSPQTSSRQRRATKKFKNCARAQEMEFLDGSISTRTTESTPLNYNNNTEPQRTQNQVRVCSTQPNIEPSTSTATQRQTSSPANTPSTQQQDIGNSRRRRIVDPSDKFFDYLRTEKSEQHEPTKQKLDKIDYLFLNYADTFKRFTPRRRALLKLNLAKLFTEAELQNLDEIEQ